MSDFNLSNILIELESSGCEGLTVQELEFVLEYIEQGIRNKVGDCKQEPAAWINRFENIDSLSYFKTEDTSRGGSGKYQGSDPVYLHPPSNVRRLSEDDVI